MLWFCFCNWVRAEAFLPGCRFSRECLGSARLNPVASISLKRVSVPPYPGCLFGQPRETCHEPRDASWRKTRVLLPRRSRHSRSRILWQALSLPFGTGSYCHGRSFPCIHEQVGTECGIACHARSFLTLRSRLDGRACISRCR